MSKYVLRSVFAVAGLIGALGAGCSDNHAGGPLPAAKPAEEKDYAANKTQGDPTPSPAPTPMTADQVFSTRCATCHGTTGHGDGPASVALNPKPRSYSDPVWQKSVTDDQIKKTIIEGGASVGKSPLMAANPDLANQPEVVEGLVKIVRSFAPKGG
jgi:mono/diheme cytochrome c family protein